MSRRTTTAIILSAGKSGRMGKLKPLMPLGKTSVLGRVFDLFHNAGISDIRVVVGHRREEIRHHLGSLRVTWVHNENYDQGMFSSVKKGVVDLPSHCSSFFMLPVDIPLVRPHTIQAMLNEWGNLDDGESILYPTFLDKRGHPPLISTRLTAEILTWSGQGGLNAFLKSKETEARNLPVIDEYILKDMDTQPEYEHITAALNRYDIPTIDECRAILENPSFVSDTVAAHCLTVSKLALFLGEQLDVKNGINLSRIQAAAMLHDVEKGHPNHARRGAELLSGLGFSGIADIVANHMDIDFPGNTPLTDREVVYLADKLVQGDRIVPLSVRFDNKLARYSQNPDAKEAILQRKNNALKIVRCFEKESGKQLETLLDEFMRCS